jgi:hypothetical protein
VYVRNIHISGFADLPDLRLSDLERVVRVQGPSPAATALGDGLALAFAALSTPVLTALLERWGLLEPEEAPEVETNPLPIQAAWADRTQAPSLVADHMDRRLQVTVDLVPDPPMFADMRALGAKAPRLSSALGADSLIQIQVSGFFAASWDVLSLSVQSFSVGDESFPTTGKERPEWLTQLLQRIGERFVIHPPSGDSAQLAMDAMTSSSAQAHAGFLRWQRALEPDLGTVRPARGPAGRPMLLSDDLPLRRFGRFGLERAGLAVSAYFSGADVMWAGLCPSWSEACVEGEGSALEQVWRITRSGDIDPSVGAQAPASGVLSFSPAAAEE